VYIYMHLTFPLHLQPNALIHSLQRQLLYIYNTHRTYILHIETPKSNPARAVFTAIVCLSFCCCRALLHIRINYGFGTVA
jgi:hypothetical protein